MPIKLHDEVSPKDIEAGFYTPLKFEAKPRRRALKALLVVLLTAVAAFLVYTRVPATSVMVPAMFAMFSLGPEYPFVKLFEVTNEYPVPTGVPVLSLVIFNQSALVDGLKAKYVAPEIFDFTGGFLTLNFSSAAAEPVSAPVVEISVGGTPIWRSATPLPRKDADVHSSTTKNITEYLSLFASDQKVTFAVLDTGVASISASLELVLFGGASNATVAKPKNGVSVSSIFTLVGPATHVYPLTKKVVSLPSETFSVTLPKLASNVTAAKVSLFVSAADDEIEFYKKDIAPFGEPVDGNGPVRQLNLFISGVYVGTVSPKPTLFHADKLTDGGAKLWDPIVSSGTYSGFTYDLDLVAVLPLLWAEGQTLDIVIVSPIDESDKVGGKLPHPVSAVTNVIDGTWYVSGSLLAWESSLVSKSVGAVVASNSTEVDLGVAIESPVASPWQPKISNQIIRSSVESVITSSFNFTLFDNSTANYLILANTSSSLVLNKATKESKRPIGIPGSGKEFVESEVALFYIAANNYDVKVLEAATSMTLFTKTSLAAYPLNLKSNYESSPFKPAPETTFTGWLTVAVSSSVNGANGPSLRVEEKLKLDDYTGATTEVKFQEATPGKFFLREVKAENGKVTSDSRSVLYDN